MIHVHISPHKRPNIWDFFQTVHKPLGRQMAAEHIFGRDKVSTMIKVHAIQTGKVKIKKFEAFGATNRITRMWQLLHTDNWTDWLPIYCWLVEHPEGPFLIDAGEIAKVHEYGYLP